MSSSYLKKLSKFTSFLFTWIYVYNWYWSTWLPNIIYKILNINKYKYCVLHWYFNFQYFILITLNIFIFLCHGRLVCILGTIVQVGTSLGIGNMNIHWQASCLWGSISPTVSCRPAWTRIHKDLPPLLRKCWE